MKKRCWCKRQESDATELAEQPTALRKKRMFALHSKVQCNAALMHLSHIERRNQEALKHVDLHASNAPSAMTSRKCTEQFIHNSCG